MALRVTCYRRKVLGIQYADGISRLGNVNWSIALALLGVFLLVYFALWKGIKSSGKVGVLQPLGHVTLARHTTVTRRQTTVNNRIDSQWDTTDNRFDKTPYL